MEPKRSGFHLGLYWIFVQTNVTLNQLVIAYCVNPALLYLFDPHQYITTEKVYCCEIFGHHGCGGVCDKIFETFNHSHGDRLSLLRRVRTSLLILCQRGSFSMEVHGYLVPI